MGSHRKPAVKAAATRGRPKHPVYVCYCHPEEVRYRDLLLAWDATSGSDWDFHLASLLHEIPSTDPAVVQSILLAAISKAECMLVIIGPGTAGNIWIDWEVKVAVGLGIPIVAVKLSQSQRGPPSLYGVEAEFVNGFKRNAILKALDEVFRRRPHRLELGRQVKARHYAGQGSEAG